MPQTPRLGQIAETRVKLRLAKEAALVGIVGIARISELGGIDKNVFRANLTGNVASFLHFLVSVGLGQASRGHCPRSEFAMRDLQEITAVNSPGERDQDRSHLPQYFRQLGLFAACGS